MLIYNWIMKDIESTDDVTNMILLFNEVKPRYGGFDTETTGLHIILDKPFLYQFGFIDEEHKIGYSFAVDIERNPELAKTCISNWHRLCKSLTRLVGVNVKYDMHMMENIGFAYPWRNITDAKIYIRLCHDALKQENGGPPMALKEYAKRYIDPHAKDHEHLIASERTAIAKHYTTDLKKRTGWTIKQFDEFFGDVLNEVDDLPEVTRKAYDEWYATIPEEIKVHMLGPLLDTDCIPYNMVNRENLIKYGHYDIVYTLEIFMRLKDIIAVRKQEQVLKIEEEVIYDFYDMERTGFEMNKPYIIETKERMKEYMLRRREDLKQLVGYSIRVNQHPTIKRILKEKYNIVADSTGSTVLDQMIPNIQDEEAKQFIKTIQELRTLDKWYQTYLMRFIKEMKRCDRVYTQIDQTGCVSGRVSSDFQQFPKYPIEDIDGNELFAPRRMVNITGFYLDYSQIELRLQAFYTILVGDPDKNLCRAYMPYMCHRVLEDGTVEQFDYTNKEHIKQWKDPRWCHDEDNTPWTKLDLHGATTKTATGLTEDDPEFKHLRGAIGKRVNFAKNYGAQRGKIAEMFPDKTPEEIDRINDAYYNTFPGVKSYHDYCYNIINAQGYGTNLFGCRYYGVNGHKLINLLVQGSGSYVLKQTVIKVCNYLRSINSPVKFQMNIHDECSFELNGADPEVIFKVKEIMEDFPEFYVPVVADIEVTKKTWADKEEFDDIESIREFLAN